jgi:hypothetical protein
MSGTKNDTRTLTIEDAGRLAAIIQGVERHWKIRYYPRGAADIERPNVMVMRAFTHQGGRFYPLDADIRDAYVWCSGLMEHWILVSDIMMAIKNATTAEYGETEPMATFDY